MATTLSSVLQLKILERFLDDLDMNDAILRLDYDHNDTMTNGTGANEADIVFHDRRELVATSEDFDLAGSAVDDDAFGTAITFAKVKLLYIKNRSTTATETLAIGGAAGTQFVNWVGNADDEVNIGPGGCFLLYSPIDGYAVGAGASDLLKIDSGADTIEFDIIIIGTKT